MARSETFDTSRRLLPFRESLLAMTGISSAAMLVALDQTIVGTALPRIVAELNGFDLYAWVATAYMLASLLAIPIFGRLGDMFGRKPFMLAAVLIFTGASVMCGVANGMLFLVISRGVQGIGGGILIGTVFATVAELFPDPKLRLRWLVFVTSTFGGANACGPAIGGFLTQYGGWRLAFFVNVPVGIASLLLLCRFLPRLRRPPALASARVDWIGGVLLIVTFGALQILIETFPSDGVTVSNIGLGAVAAAGGVVLWVWERNVSHPIVPLDMLLDRKLMALYAMSLLGGFALFSLVFYVPLLFQAGFSMSPHSSGMLITPLLFGTSVGSMINNRIVTQIRRANAIMFVGFALSTLACLGVVALNGTEPHVVWMACMGVSGLGLGLAGTSLTLCSQQLVSRDHLGATTALLQSLRTLGGMLGTVMTGALMGKLYARGVYRSLDAYQATQWFKSFASPTLLVDRAEQTALINRLILAGHAGGRMMHAAREALVNSIHIGLVVAAAAALAGLCLACFVPPVCIGHVPSDAATD
jgi:EmrB/QacA subfamily drug resistance transporter